MSEKFGLYKCNICGNVVQVMVSGTGELVCCQENMEYLISQSHENMELGEKHIPIIETIENKTKVNLPHHPMIPEHYIQFIQVFNVDKSEFRTKFLHPSENAEFDITGFEPENAIEFCNIHELWANH